jgi:ATP-dependent protease ClpP protease subunit
METAPIEVCEEFSEEIWPWSREALLARMTEHAYHGVARVVLDISSPGGEVACAMSLYQQLRSTPFELVTHNTGKVASMGNVLFLAGNRRVATPEATFLMHPTAFETPTGYTFDANDLRIIRTELEHSGDPLRLLREVDIGIARLTREDGAVRTIFEERTKLAGSEIRALVQRGKPVDAAYAKAAGIVHEIIPASRS